VSLPIRARLTIWYIAVLAVILVLSGTFIVLRLRAELVGNLDKTLRSSATEIASDYKNGGEGEFRDVSDVSLAGLPRDRSAAQLLSTDGTVLAWSGNAIGRRPIIDAAARASALGGQGVNITESLGAGKGSEYRVLAVSYARGETSGLLVVATSLADTDQAVHNLLMLLMLGGPIALVAAGAGGWWLARKALQPVAQMTSEASEIGVDRLGERVAVPAAADELQRLALTLNAMLSRLQRGVEQERRFVSDASHELRTPLAIMRSEIDVALRSPELTGEAREVLESAGEETDRMARIVEDLLTLARIDEGQLKLTRSPFDLSSLAAEVISSMQPLAARRGVTLDREDNRTVVVEADRARIQQVVANLVDNALKYSKPGGTVRLDVRSDGTEAALDVADTGPGIPPELLPNLFDRFFRADQARSREEGGSGLGLAICREMVEAHGGRISATSEVGRGSVFSFALPLSARVAEGSG
jgi:two-component system OmpR family sensor kinase